MKRFTVLIALTMFVLFWASIQAKAQTCQGPNCRVQVAGQTYAHPVYLQQAAPPQARVLPSPSFTPASPSYAPTVAVAPDPLAALNAYRARYGLRPLAWDASLASAAAVNNQYQARRGMGHYYVPNCWQCAAWNYPDAASAVRGWASDAPHRAILLDPYATRAGLAVNGVWSTLNVVRR